MPYCKNCGNEFPEGATYCPKCGASTAVVIGLRTATWGERFIAWLIDVIILGIITTPLKLLLVAAWPGFAWPLGNLLWIPFSDLGLGSLVHFLYWMFMEGAYGQSLGKMIMRIKVVRLDGGRMNIPQAALESVGKAFLLPLDCLLGWILYPSKRQRIFNYISETIVTRVP